MQQTKFEHRIDRSRSRHSRPKQRASKMQEREMMLATIRLTSNAVDLVGQEQSSGLCGNNSCVEVCDSRRREMKEKTNVQGEENWRCQGLEWV